MFARVLSALLVLGGLSVGAGAQYNNPAAVDGVWLGRLDTGSSVRMQFHLANAGEGKLTCSVDYVDLGAAARPCAATWDGAMNGAVKIEIKGARGTATFDGLFTNSGIKGTYHSSVTVPLVLERQAAALPVTKAAVPKDELKTPTKDDLLRGAYGPYRANNDLLFYKLVLRVDPVAKTIKGSNSVRFKMLADGTRIQLELSPDLKVDGITWANKTLAYTREERTVWVDFPETLKKGRTYELKFAYSGEPKTQGRFGCFSFDKDTDGKPWITTACEEEGASTWWPNKDQWRDEPQEGMEMDIAVPDGLMDVSNGRAMGSRSLGDGYTEWMWRVHYPINNYDVALNIGNYQHFSGVHGKTTLDYYALPADLEKAKKQFAQVPEMLDAYEHFFGEYPFAEDGYKLIEVPYAGMEHQSAVAYGNHFENGYYGRDWTGVRISPKFDFIIIHESGHEWFGNSITAADKSDMWIHEGWTTYLEVLYVEYRWGKEDSIRYVNGLKPKVQNERPIITPRNTNAEPPQDQYFKGALMINTLRTMIGDEKFLPAIHDFYQHFKYQNIMTEDVVAWWNARTGMDLTAFFDEYLRHAAIPVLELKFAKGEVSYRYKADEAKFAMPVRVGDPAKWNVVTPVTTEWKTMPWAGAPEDFKVDEAHYYLGVERDGK